MENTIVYHYTSFDKFEQIMKNGTLRFKESTASNDYQDTTLIVDVLTKMELVSAVDSKEKAALEFILNLYKKTDIAKRYIHLVSCFSKVPDSRMLWDAYTMNRPSNHKCDYGDKKYCEEHNKKYNGVCIGFKEEALLRVMQGAKPKYCTEAYNGWITYGVDNIANILLKQLSEFLREVDELSDDPDQNQDIIKPIRFTPLLSTYEFKLKKSIVYPTINLMGIIAASAPFYKHEFWNEEAEYRLSLCVDSTNIPKDISEFSDGSRYVDLNITEDCIDHIILGPEFSDSENDIINNSSNSIDFSKVTKKTSLGTGIIRSM